MNQKPQNDRMAVQVWRKTYEKLCRIALRNKWSFTQAVDELADEHLKRNKSK